MKKLRYLLQRWNKVEKLIEDAEEILVKYQNKSKEEGLIFFQ